VAPTIYKLVDEPSWRGAMASGQFTGSAVDLADGYIHFSTAAQVQDTAARHFAGHQALLLVAVSSEALGARLRWEPSRGGELFPHLYSTLPVSSVRWVQPLPVGSDGRHAFPPLDE
jgi:uncharacterized protein (DUF952 family)